MIDCGATGLFLDSPFVERHRITTFLLRNPISLLNIDGSPNNAGKITHFARLMLTIDNYSEWNDFLITNLGGENLILGLPWLRKVNPTIDWELGTLSIPPSCNPSPSIEEIPDEDSFPTFRGAPTGDALVEEIGIDYDSIATGTTAPAPTSSAPTPDVDLPDLATPLLDTLTFDNASDAPPPVCRINANRRLRRAFARKGFLEDTSDQLWCAAGYTYSQKIAEEAQKDKPAKSFEDMVPPQYRQHAHVFSESESQRLPEHKPWDHAIKFTPDAPATPGLD